MRIIGQNFRETYSGDKVMTILTTHNKLKRRLYFDAAMSFPDKKGMFKTNVLPIEPGLFSFESWSQPIVRLVLSNFRFAPKDVK